MNAAKWDEKWSMFDNGHLEPANGREVWAANAAVEAALIRNILPLEVAVIVEVGCGIGRLTPNLAPLFWHVYAVDTSVVACKVTRAVAPHRNVTVTVLHGELLGRAVQADAAVVWGNMYDADWTLDAARLHIEDLAKHYPLVLVQTARQEIRDAWTPAAASDDWFLIEMQ